MMLADVCILQLGPLGSGGEVGEGLDNHIIVSGAV